MRKNLSSSHRQGSWSVKDNSLFSFLNSYFERLLLCHLFPIGIDDDISWFWTNIYRNCCLSIKNSCIRTSNGQMHDIGSGFIKFIVYNWSITNRLICSINISIVPEIISWWNSFIGRICTRSCIKSHGQRSWSRAWWKWSRSFYCIFILDSIGNSSDRNFTIFIKWIKVFSGCWSCHSFCCLLTLLVHYLKSIFLRKIRKNLCHDRIKFCIQAWRSDFSCSRICINFYKNLQKSISLFLDFIISKIFSWDNRVIGRTSCQNSRSKSYKQNPRSQKYFWK